jgi:hypothetical protein
VAAKKGGQQNNQPITGPPTAQGEPVRA